MLGWLHDVVHDFLVALSEFGGTAILAVCFFLIKFILFGLLGLFLVGLPAIALKAIASKWFGNRSRLARASVRAGALVGLAAVAIHVAMSDIPETHLLFVPLGIGIWEVAALAVLWVAAPVIDYLWVLRPSSERLALPATIGFLFLSNLWIPWAALLMGTYDSNAFGTPCKVESSAILADPGPCENEVRD